MSKIYIFLFSSRISLIVTFIGTSSCDDFNSNIPTFECLAASLKANNINDPIFENILYDSKQKKCVSAIKSFKEKVQVDIYKKIHDENIEKFYSDCVYMKLTAQETFVNSVLKAAALEYSGIINDRKIYQVSTPLADMITMSIYECQNEKDFGDQFDSYFIDDDSPRNITDYQEDYCISIYAMKMKIVNQNISSIIVNPMNISVQALQCDRDIEFFINAMQTQFGKSYLDNPLLGDPIKAVCATKKFRESGYAQVIIKTIVLSKNKISSRQKVIEKENFVRICTEMVSAVALC